MFKPVLLKSCKTSIHEILVTIFSPGTENFGSKLWCKDIFWWVFHCNALFAFDYLSAIKGHTIQIWINIEIVIEIYFEIQIHKHTRVVTRIEDFIVWWLQSLIDARTNSELLLSYYVVIHLKMSLFVVSWFYFYIFKREKVLKVHHKLKWVR